MGFFWLQMKINSNSLNERLMGGGEGEGEGEGLVASVSQSELLAKSHIWGWPQRALCGLAGNTDAGALMSRCHWGRSISGEP